MSNLAERNDVDINKLFNWGKQFIIVDINEKPLFEVYQRVIGDADVNKSRVFALRKSAEFRKKLYEKDSEERLAYLPDIELLDKETLVDLVVAYTLQDYTKEIIKNINVPYPKEPKSDASLEEFEKYQSDVDHYPTKKDEIIAKEVDKVIEQRRTNVGKLSIEALYKEVEKAIINEACNKMMVQVYTSSCTYYSIYKDEAYREKLFNSYEEFDNLPTDIKTQFIYNYSTLDIDASNLK